MEEPFPLDRRKTRVRLHTLVASKNCKACRWYWAAAMEMVRQLCVSSILMAALMAETPARKCLNLTMGSRMAETIGMDVTTCHTHHSPTISLSCSLLAIILSCSGRTAILVKTPLPISNRPNTSRWGRMRSRRH